ncbi:PREDICTED: isoamylase 2, chloroplastic-like [Camelina sativa]|uniref:Isoamylase 2, chloroplastic-like n=1 Tax=Camelina sativa TaxID=90675 RepID=A0ABM0WR23_CAMSA|nr:PREDICTED: isoamylase 2, chloroplastic-like [Camelina sativa]XP_010474953.1 PREDICTED: isoamylase 2, chloroplastic-like [Camelina sativa]
MAAAWSPSLGFCLNKGITRTWKFPSARSFTGKDKIKHGSESLIVTRKRFLGDLSTDALQSYQLSKVFASKTTIELKDQVSTRRAQVYDLKKVTSYLFRTKSGALIKVKVEKKREKYSIMVYVSSLELSGDDKSRLVMVWGVYRSDSSCFLPLDFENSSQDSQTHTTETPFVKSSLSELMLGLEFDGKESPFYLSFYLKLVSGKDPDGQELLTHRDTDFCVPVGFTAGRPLPLGLSSGPDDETWNFAFFSRNSTNVVLCLYDDTTTDKPALELDLDPYVNRTGDVWHASVDNTWDFVRYGYRCKEMTQSEEDIDVEAEPIVLDPYATVIDKYVSHKFLASLFKNPSFDWGEDVSPNIPLEKLIVYRLNVKGFTQHKSSKLPSNVAGTFSGVAEKVHHLKSLGINAVLLEPIFSFSEQKGPYFPVHFFSPMDMYGPSSGVESAVKSMKEMVKKLHSQGIEVLLEVVFTHTADSGALRGIDDSCYYYKGRANDLDLKSYLNCNHPVVQQLVLESLRYWVTEFHVDGFCFINASSLLRGVHGEQLSRPPLVEAIAFDPLLAETKLIADCWDPLEVMPKEVRFPHWKRWAELNTRYCRNVRNFLRGKGVLSDLATRVCGSGDIFTDGRGPAFSFNYISRNSGLSLVDLVSFSGPELASELSWNCGEEGATNKSAVLQRRLKQIRNFLFIQYISLGIPVLNMGDECGISTKGSPLLESRKSFDWNMIASAFGTQITQFISFMTSVRARRSDVFQRRNFLKPENIAWYANDQTTPKWEDPACKFLALGIKAEAEEEETASLVEPTEPNKNNDLFIGFNASDHPESVILPSLSDGSKWRRLVDTALPFPGFFSVQGETVVAEEQMQQLVVYEMKPYSCTLFETVSSTA